MTNQMIGKRVIATTGPDRQEEGTITAYEEKLSFDGSIVKNCVVTYDEGHTGKFKTYQIEVADSRPGIGVRFAN